MDQKLAITGIILLVVATIVLAAPKPRPPEGKSFYLTTTQHDGLNAPFACAAGYHMANIYEILDPTGLRYDMSFGATADDSGSGPPGSDDFSGWVRGGRNVTANPSPHQFEHSCQAYQSSDSELLGSQVFLSSVVAPWGYRERQCNLTFPVWCVSD